MNTYCSMKTTKYERTGKATFKPYETEEKAITEEQYNNITNDDTLRWFRRLGGSETAQRCYTSKGYVVFKLISTSPCKTEKVIREFNFK